MLRFVDDDRKLNDLRRELSGFSHRCRNMLSSLKLSLYFAKREIDGPIPPLWRSIEHSYAGIEKLLDQLQAIYRPMNLTPVRTRFNALVQERKETWSQWFTDRNGTFDVVAPREEQSGELDPMTLGMGLDAFFRWRSLIVLPAQRPILAWRTSGHHFQVEWIEPRIPGLDMAAVSRGDSSLQRLPAGVLETLALPLLARVMTAHRGRLEWTDAPEFRVALTWPLAQPPAPANQKSAREQTA